MKLVLIFLLSGVAGLVAAQVFGASLLVAVIVGCAVGFMAGFFG